MTPSEQRQIELWMAFERLDHANLVRDDDAAERELTLIHELREQTASDVTAVAGLAPGSASPQGGYAAFISYRRRLLPSAAVAGNLHRLLEDRGVRTYFDTEEIRPGEEWLRSIDAAATDPALRVGIVVIERDWVAMLGQTEDGREDIALREVEQFLRRRDGAASEPAGSAPFVVYPIYVLHPIFDPAGFPDPPEGGSERVRAVYDSLYELQALPANAFDHHVAVEAAADHIRDLVQGRGGDGALGRPRSLSELARDDGLRTQLFEHAERLDVGFPDLRIYTLLGQKALLNQDFDLAHERLSAAWGRAHDDFSSGSESLRHHERRLVWMVHASNMLAVAVLRGERPRRLGLRAATDLWHGVLSPAVGALAESIARSRPPAGEWATSTDHVAAVSLALLHLVHEDFFRSRHLGYGKSTPYQIETLASATRTLHQHLPAELADETRAEIAFLKQHFLEELPESDPSADVRPLSPLPSASAQAREDPEQAPEPPQDPPPDPPSRSPSHPGTGGEADDTEQRRRFGILLTKTYDGDPHKPRHRESLFRRGLPPEREPTRRKIGRLTALISAALIVAVLLGVDNAALAALLLAALIGGVTWGTTTLLRTEDRPFRAVPIEVYDRSFDDAARASHDDAVRRLGWDEKEDVYAQAHFAIPLLRLIPEVTAVDDAVGPHSRLRFAIHVDEDAPPDKRYRFSAYEFHHVYAKHRWLGYARSRFDFLAGYPAEAEHLDYEQWRLSDVVSMRVTPTTFTLGIAGGERIVIPLAAKTEDDDGDGENGDGEDTTRASEAAPDGNGGPSGGGDALRDFEEEELIPDRVEQARIFVNMVRLLSDEDE
jgi:hypothetical protein